MRDGLGHVPVVTLLAVMAVTSRCVVSTVQTDTTTSPPWQLIELHVETTTSGMQITVARWVERSRRRGWNSTFALETSCFYYNPSWLLIKILGDVRFPPRWAKILVCKYSISTFPLRKIDTCYLVLLFLFQKKKKAASVFTDTKRWLEHIADTD